MELKQEPIAASAQEVAKSLHHNPEEGGFKDQGQNKEMPAEEGHMVIWRNDTLNFLCPKHSLIHGEAQAPKSAFSQSLI